VGTEFAGDGVKTPEVFRKNKIRRSRCRDSKNAYHARIRADTFPHCCTSAPTLSQIFATALNERDFHRQEGIRCVLISRALGAVTMISAGTRAGIRPRIRIRSLLIFAAGERSLDGAHHGGAALLVGSGNDAIRVEEIRDRGSPRAKIPDSSDIERALRRAVLLHHPDGSRRWYRSGPCSSRR